MGYYTGTFYETEHAPDSHYAVSLSCEYVVAPERPKGGMHPLAMMNEPPLGQTANATVVDWRYARDALPELRGSTEVAVAAVHACRDVHVGEEIFFHYGEEYDRSHYGRKPHNVGTPCSEWRNSFVAKEERPRAFAEANGWRVAEGFAYLELE